MITYTVLPSSTATPSPGGAAPNQADYTALSGTVTIAANATSAQIPVSVLQDAVVEDDETVTIELASVSAGNPMIFLGAIGGPVLTFRQGLNGYTGTQDTTLSQTNGFSNFGSAVDLQVDTDDVLPPPGGSPSPASDMFQALIEFENIFGAGLGLIPVGSPIASALLDFFVIDGGDAPNLHELLVPFSEGVITWDNAKFAGNTDPGIQGDDREAKSAVVDSEGPGGSYDVTSSLAAWSLVPTANHGWVLMPTGLDDVIYDSSESTFTADRPTLTVTLDLTATVTICDTDTATVQVGGSSPAAEPLTDGAIFVTQTAVSSSPTVVAYTLTGGSATEGSDYEVLSGTVTIPAGATSAPIVIEVKDDSLAEATEDVQITIDSITSSDPEITLGTPLTGSTTILDNEVAKISVSATTTQPVPPAAPDKTATETPTDDGIFTFVSSVASDVDTVINFNISGTATNGSDYATIAASVTIPAFFTSASVLIDVTDDMLNESTEDVTLTIDSIVPNGVNHMIDAAADSDTIEILDNDALTVDVTATKPLAVEGDSDGEFVISLNKASDQPTVIVYTVGGTATPGDGTVTVPPRDYVRLPGTNATFLSGTVTIAAGSTSAVLPVDVDQDFVKEMDETVIVTIFSASNVNPPVVGGVGDTDTVTIEDESFKVQVFKTDSPAAEPGPPVGNHGQFTITMDNPLPVNTVVGYTVTGTAVPSPGGAIPNQADYVQLPGSATILAGQTSVVIDVDIIDDMVVENSETVIITINSATAAAPYAPLPMIMAGMNDVATETIADDDSALLSIAGTKNGAEPGGTANDGEFTITQSKPASTNTVVRYIVLASSTATPTPGGAVPNQADYTAIGTATATILAGNTTVTFPVDVLDDLVVEATETVVVQLDTILSSDPQVTIDASNDEGTVNIVDNDTATLTVSAPDAFGSEPGANDGRFAFTLSQPSSTPTVVAYSVGGDATAGSDYTTLSGTVTIPAGATSATALVDVLDDNLVEDNETVIASIAAGSIISGDPQITVTPGNATVTILDNDTAKVSLAGTTDGVEGGANGVFTVTSTNPSDAPITVTYQIVVGSTTADEGDDFTPLSGTVVIPVGATTATIDVPVINDDLVEKTEVLTLELLSASTDGMAMLDTGAKTDSIDILDNDTATYTISDVSVVEGDSGTTTMTFYVEVDKQVDIPVQIDVGYADDTATGGGVDYDDTTDSVTFPAFNTTSMSVTVSVTPEQLVEADETFDVSLSTPTMLMGRSLDLSDTAVGEIRNDDKATFSITSDSVMEGTAPNIAGETAAYPYLEFTVAYDNPIDVSTVIDVDFTDGTAIGGDFSVIGDWDAVLPDTPDPIPGTPTGFDYDNDADEMNTGLYSTLLTFPAQTAGDTPPSLTFRVRVNPDNLVEGGAAGPSFGLEDLTAFLIDTTGTRNTDVTDTGTGQIEDDDAAEVYVEATITPAMEPDQDGEFTLYQTLPSQTDTVINVTIGGTADAGVDYVAISTPLTIPAGATSAKVPVEVLNNPVLEDDETVVLTLDSLASSDFDVNLSTMVGPLMDTVFIFDDDDALLSIMATADAAEPGTDGEFTLTLTEIADTNTVVTLMVSGTATPGSDYVALPMTVTIPAGSTQTTVDVSVIDDALEEGTETVTVALGSLLTPTNADIELDPAKSSDTVNIGDDDGAIKVVVMPLTNGAEPETNGSFKLTLVRATDGTPVPAPPAGLLVSYSLGGTADIPLDFIIDSVLFIPGGATSAVVEVDVEDDMEVEGDETVIITLVSTALFGGIDYPTPPVGTTGMFMVDTTPASIIIVDNDTAAAPVVSGVDVNDGENQRSKLTTMKITFNSLVNWTADAFTVEKRSDTIPGAVTDTIGTANGLIVTDVTGGGSQTMLELTFNPGAGNPLIDPVTGSLVDGNYQVQIDATKVDFMGVPLDGDGNGTGGDDFTHGDQASDRVFALYGDGDGDGDVDVDDVDAMVAAVGSSAPAPAYDYAFDSDDDGVIDLDDVDDFVPAVGKMRNLGGY